MSLILKQEPANTISTPPAGKSTLFVTDSSTMAVKNPDGTVTYFPTVSGSNTQILFNDNGSINGNANLIFNKTTSTMTVANLSVTGTLNAGDISVSSIANGTSNVDIIGVGGNVTTSVGGVANILVVTSTGANVTGTLSASGNITAPNFIGNIEGSANSATTAGTVTTAAQPNITSTGTLSSLSSSGNITGANLITAGKVYSSEFINGGTGVYLSAGPSGYINFFTTGGDKATITDTGNIAASNLIANSTVFAGTANVSGNVNAGNVVTGGIVSATGNVTASFFIGNGSQLTGLNTAGVSNGNSNVNIATANGNVTIAAVGNTTMTITGNGANISGTLSVSGNANVGNIGAAAGVFTTVAGSLSTASQPNITSVGTLTSVSVSGNATVGNISATNYTGTTVSVTGNVTGGNLVTAGILSVTGTGVSSIAGNLDMTSNTIINLATPTNSTDAATKQYVDDVAQGLNIHDSCNAATTATLATISGGTVTYNNGISGVGANLTTTGSFNLIDGVNVQSSGTRILVKNEANAAHNGIYTWSNATVITRAIDFNSVPEVEAGDFTFITAGTVYDNTGWVQTSSVTTIGTDAIEFTQFSGAGTYTAGTGLTLTGSVFSVNVAQPTITSVGTLTSLSVSGNANVGNIGAAAGIFTTVAGSLTTAAQGNITSVGTLTSLGVNGTVTAVNFTANTGVFAGSGANLTTLNASNISSGTLAQARLANASLTVNGTSVTLGSSGTITANTTQILTLGSYLTGTSFNGGTAVTATVDAATVNTGSKIVARDANGDFAARNITATLIGAATTAGTVTTAAQANITSVGTLTSLNVSGQLTNANITTGANTTAGNLTGNWTLSVGSRLQATYADLAEKYVSDAEYTPGTVLIFGGDKEVTLANEFDSTRVAGVVTTNPAYVMNSACEGEHVVNIALQGRAPVKVTGPVYKGDLLVSGNNGHATANNIARAGTIIGKSLENFNGESGIIEVAVGRF